VAGDLYYPYTEYPDLDWYSENGRVVLELDPSHAEIVKSVPAPSLLDPLPFLSDASTLNAAILA
jgi:hypothetical protein